MSLQPGPAVTPDPTGSRSRPPGERWRAAYACDAAAGPGRLLPEPASPSRSDFQRDRDRILHSGAFRRLIHKTQVFIWHEGDHFRTRLTHTLEVSQIARALARSLGLDEDLAEALALAHDLGHTPFGHTGEEALDACLAAVGGFDHNTQAFRVVTRLERRYAAFDGLNLTFETIEGLVKHNGPLLGRDGVPSERYRRHGISAAILAYDRESPLGLDRQAPAEAQAAAIADDIAYDAHDIDDGLRAGILLPDQLREVAFLDDILREIDAQHPSLDPPRRAHELVRRLITRLVEDVLAESARRLAALAPADAEAIRAAAEPVIGFSAAVRAAERDIKAFLMARLYRHPRLLPVRRDAERIVADLFARYTAEPALMPEEWRQGLGQDGGRLARRVGDYVAGMTDRYALLEHRRLFDTTPHLRLA